MSKIGSCDEYENDMEYFSVETIPAESVALQI